ncbi:MAG: hypothetical protein HQL77_15590 [Magnetococcales bacterium]|nr:hypothetical protein [Magnetococcales bacterium]
MIDTGIPNYWHRLPLVGKVTSITVAVSVVLWILFHSLHYDGMQHTANAILLQEARQQVVICRNLLEASVRTQGRVVNLLSERQVLLDYVASRWYSLANVVPDPPLSHEQSPAWLPAREVVRDLVYSPFVLLLDSNGVVRESYQERKKALPDQLARSVALTVKTGKSLVETTIREIDGVDYLVSGSRIITPSGEHRGYLLLATPLDDDFFSSLQLQLASNSILVLLNPDGQSVRASGQRDLVQDGRTVPSLQSRYVIQRQTLFVSDVATESSPRVAAILIPRDGAEEIIRIIQEDDYDFLGVGLGALLLLFLFIIRHLAGNAQALIEEMLSASRQMLGTEPTLAKGGDPLRVMQDQFRLLIGDVAEVRRHLEEREKELTLANKSLLESLVMVKRTQSKLFEAEKMAYLGSLVAGVAHEINTPVGIGITAASFLESKCRQFQSLMDSGKMKKGDLVDFIRDARESSEMVLNNLQRAAELIRSFKQVAVDQSSEERRHINMNDYVGQIFKSLHPRLKKTGITVTYDCPENLNYDGYPGVLSQIITNLVENSIQHGFAVDEAGTIQLKIDALDDNIRMEYRDSGRGMTHDVQERIFEPFFTTARKRGGSGLGLHIVYNLVTQSLKGTIQCDSSPGSGVLFILVFPGSHGTFPE